MAKKTEEGKVKAKDLVSQVEEIQKKELEEKEDYQKINELYNERVIEDEIDNAYVCMISGKFLNKDFGFNIEQKHYKQVGAMFIVVYETIMDFLIEQSKKRPDYEIRFADKLLFGYTSSGNEEDEKEGNSMIYIRHLDNKKKDEISEDAENNPVRISAEWVNNNVEKQPEAHQEIASKAIENMKKRLNLHIGVPEFIIPIFIKTYECLIGYMNADEDLKFKKGVYSINFLGCFEIKARKNEDGLCSFDVRPSIADKLALKSDERASSKFD